MNIEKLKGLLKMRDEELMAKGWTQAQLDAGEHLPKVSGAVGNSTQLLTDMASAIANQPYSATATAAALAAAGPIEDLNGMVKSILLNFQEAQMKLNYILNGSQLVATTITAPPTAGNTPLIATATDSSTYNLLVGIYQILK